MLHSPQSRPLAVELEGALLRTDLFAESFVSVLKHAPLSVIRMPFWLLSGTGAFRREIARHARLDLESLPFDRTLLRRLQEERKSGRALFLVGGPGSEAVASHLGIFDGVMEEAALAGRFGENFDRAPEETRGPPDRSFPKSLAVAARLHHWIKNILIFLPMAAAHDFLRPDMLLRASTAFVSFGLCASGIYIVNDLLDLEADRHHPKKKYRPFACGRLSIWAGLAAAPVFLAASFALGSLLPEGFTLILAGYVAATTLYSTVLKRVVIVDVVCLSLLYALRIFAGAAATSTPLSKWFLIFALFFFLSLAFSKRFSELHMARRFQKTSMKGRNYVDTDLGCLGSLGSASGLVSVMVLALYVGGEDVSSLYRRPQLLWLLCPVVLVWIGRLWLLTYRGSLRLDPIVFALEDKASYLAAVSALLIFLFAI